MRHSKGVGLVIAHYGPTGQEQFRDRDYGSTGPISGLPPAPPLADPAPTRVQTGSNAGPSVARSRPNVTRP